MAVYEFGEEGPAAYGADGSFLSLIANGIKLEGGISWIVHTNDHRPPRVQVKRPGTNDIRLSLEDGSLLDRWPPGVSARKVRQMQQLAAEHGALLQTWWDKGPGRTCGDDRAISVADMRFTGLALTDWARVPGVWLRCVSGLGHMGVHIPRDMNAFLVSRRPSSSQPPDPPPASTACLRNHYRRTPDGSEPGTASPGLLEQLRSERRSRGRVTIDSLRAYCRPAMAETVPPTHAIGRSSWFSV